MPIDGNVVLGVIGSLPKGYCLSWFKVTALSGQEEGSLCACVRARARWRGLWLGGLGGSNSIYMMQGLGPLGIQQRDSTNF